MVTVRAAEAVILGDKSQHAKDDGGERERVGLLQDLVQPRTHPGAGGGGHSLRGSHSQGPGCGRTHVSLPAADPCCRSRPTSAGVEVRGGPAPCHPAAYSPLPHTHTAVLPSSACSSRVPAAGSAAPPWTSSLRTSSCPQGSSGFHLPPPPGLPRHPHLVPPSSHPSLGSLTSPGQ